VYRDECENCYLYGTNVTKIPFDKKDCFRPQCQLLRKTKTLEEYFEGRTKQPLEPKEFIGWHKPWAGTVNHFFVKDRDRKISKAATAKSLCGQLFIDYSSKSIQKKDGTPKKPKYLDPNNKKVKDKCKACSKRIESMKLHL
jgi:hypothetical protein